MKHQTNWIRWSCQWIRYSSRTARAAPLGFLGHVPAGVLIGIAFKKPKGRQLSLGQQLDNQLLSSNRVGMLDDHSGLKRLRMLKAVCRLHQAQVRDRIRVVACGLPNLRVAGIDTDPLYQPSSRPQAYVNL